MMKVILFALLGVYGLADDAKPHRSETHRQAQALQNVDIPDLKDADVCLATTQDTNNDKMFWLLTCLDSQRKYVQHERRIATEKPVGEDEISYGDLEITVEMQNRGFRLASTQEGLFFVRK